MKLLRKILACLIRQIYYPFLLCFLQSLLIQPSSAQETLGIVNSNYTGINSLWINPANGSYSRNTISLNLLAGDGFIISNYLYIH